MHVEHQRQLRNNFFKKVCFKNISFYEIASNLPTELTLCFDDVYVNVFKSYVSIASFRKLSLQILCQSRKFFFCQ